jgi:hypothetical protein
MVVLDLDGNELYFPYEGLAVEGTLKRSADRR